MIMNAVIVYYSMSGNSKLVAEAIAERIGADTLELVPVKQYPDTGFKKYFWGGKSAIMGAKPALQPYSFNADKYDTVIIGSPVWASSFTPPLRTFIEENRATLAGKRLAAFVCYMGSGDKKALKKLAKLLEIEEFEAQMALVEPKSKSAEEIGEQVESFCRALKSDD